MERKFRIRVDTPASAQSPLRKLLFLNNGQNVPKSRYQNFLVLLNFLILAKYLVIDCRYFLRLINKDPHKHLKRGAIER